MPVQRSLVGTWKRSGHIELGDRADCVNSNRVIAGMLSKNYAGSSAKVFFWQRVDDFYESPNCNNNLISKAELTDAASGVFWRFRSHAGVPISEEARKSLRADNRVRCRLGARHGGNVRERGRLRLPRRHEWGGYSKRVAAAISESGGAAKAIYGDVRDPECIDKVAATAGSQVKSLDILVNNAGNLIRKDFHEAQDDGWASVLDTHLWGTLRMTRALLPLLQQAGKARGAAVVNVASIMASLHARQVTSYSTSKAAIEGLSRSLAVEFAPHGIRVNYICPGFVPTAMTRQYTRQGFSEPLIRRIPLRRFGTPQEIAKVALFLSCEDSSYITGQGITADGGMSINLI